MAADFIEQDGNIYLRLTGSTTQVSFSADSTASFTYTMYFAGLQVKNTGTLTHEINDGNNTNILFQGNGSATFVNEVPEDAGGHEADTTFNINAKHYTVTWTTPFPNANYTPTITIIDNRTASGQSSGMVLFAISDITASSFKVQFRTTTKSPEPQDLGYVRSFSASASIPSGSFPFSISKNGGVNDPSYEGINQVITSDGSGTRLFQVTGVNQDNTQYTTTSTSNFLCLGNTVLEFQNGVIANPGVAQDKNIFVKLSGNWKPSRNIFVKDDNAWKQCEKVWVKSNGVWKESYLRNSSDWVNMLELYDDTLDFAVQVVAQN